MNESRLSNGLFVAAFSVFVVCASFSVGSCTRNGPGAETPDAGNTDTGSTPDTSTTDVATGSDVPVAPTDTGNTTPPGARNSAKVFFLGHSLLGWDAPSMLSDFAAATDVALEYDAAVGIGANLAWQWEHPDRAEGENPRVKLDAEPYDLLVLTEAIPIRDQVTGANSVDNALNFARLAHAQNPDVQVYIYETWEHRRDNTWRESINTERAYYDQIVDGVNAGFEGRDVLLIPGGQAMGALIDRIRAGSVPGMSDEGALFHDDIHLSVLGWYFIACVHYATIYQRSPVGVPTQTQDRFEQPFEAPSAEVAAVMQQVAWEVVSSDPRSGVSN